MCRARWVVLSGSLPPGVPADFYATLVRSLRPLGVKVAVDTSDEPLLALVDNFPEAAPDLASLADVGASVAAWLGLDAARLGIGSPAALVPR